MTQRTCAATATTSPADAPIPNRRTLLGSAALAAVVSATATLPAAAAEPGPVEAAYRIWIIAAKAADVVIEALEEAEERYEAPDRPRFQHMRDEGGYDVEYVDLQGKQGRLFCRVDRENVEALKAIVAAPFDASDSAPDGIAWDRVTHQRVVDRARATLAQVEAWRTEAERRAEVCGLTAARRRAQPLVDRMFDARAAVFALTPASYRDAAYMAAMLDDDWNEAAAARLMEALRTIAGIPAYDDRGAATPSTAML